MDCMSKTNDRNPESQLAMIGGRLATLKRGDVKAQHEKDAAQICAPSSLEEYANMLNVGKRSVVSAKQMFEVVVNKKPTTASPKQTRT